MAESPWEQFERLAREPNESDPEVKGRPLCALTDDTRERQGMTITEQDIEALTPAHRVVWHSPPGAPVEMGLYVDKWGQLVTDVGYTIRYPNGGPALTAGNIVRIIEPTLVPRRGLVIGHPTRLDEDGRLVCFGPDEWYGLGRPHSDAEARDLVENCGWAVKDDLTKEKRDG